MKRPKIQRNAENRTSDNRTTPKSEQICVRLYVYRSDFERSGLWRIVRFSDRLNKTVLYIYIFLWPSLYIKRPSLVSCLKSERSNDFCSDFEQKFLSEIRTFLFGFRRYLQPNVIYNRTDCLCLKSELFAFRTLTVYV